MAKRVDETKERHGYLYRQRRNQCETDDSFLSGPAKELTEGEDDAALAEDTSKKTSLLLEIGGAFVNGLSESAKKNLMALTTRVRNLKLMYLKGPGAWSHCELLSQMVIVMLRVPNCMQKPREKHQERNIKKEKSRNEKRKKNNGL